jgi:phosphoserine phosphatase RsbU/P
MLNSLTRLSLDFLHSKAPEPVVSLQRSDLRWQLLVIAVAVLLLSIALGAFALYLFRRRARELTLLDFGAFCTLYAARMLINTPLFRDEFDFSNRVWALAAWCITAVVILPIGLFCYQIIAMGMGRALPILRVLRVVLVVQAVCGVLGIVDAFLGANLDRLYNANSILVLGSFAVLAVAIAWRRITTPAAEIAAVPRELRVLLAGFLVWLAFIVFENLRGLGVVRGSPHSIEFLGFLVFVAALGYVAAYRTFATEERLLAINTELAIARQIQTSTLPQNVPELAGLEIAARYIPMSAVAGDFYDFLLIDKQRIGILIADVTGHGVPAALIAAMLKVSFAAQTGHADQPARVLDGLNRALCGKFEEYFVTAAYLYIDLGNGRAEYAGAAHPALMHVSGATGEVREYEENGLMLGMFPEARYRSMEIPVAAGDRCVLWTDGILEARTIAEEEYGKTRAADAMRTQRGASAAMAADELLASVVKFSGYNAERSQHDDMTLLVVDFN